MRVVIVAHGPAGADAVRRALRYAPACQVIGWVDVRRTCAPAIVDARPDVVVVDQQAGDPVMERAREIRAAVPDAKVILLAARMDPDLLADAAAAELDAAIAKTTPAACVGILIREVAAGHVVQFARRGAHVERQLGSAHPAGCLTARERQILGLVAAGLSNGRIAEALFVTEQTVKFHLSNVYRKLGLSNRTEAASFAHIHGLVAAAETALRAAA